MVESAIAECKKENAMHISFVPSLFPFLLASVLGVGLALPSLTQAVQCGDKLTSGDTVVLDSDLACPILDPDGSSYEGGLVVGGGTILDLNGHTISCTGGLKRAIRMGGATLRNGTIVNCEEGIYVGSGATVEHLVFTNNSRGVVVEGGDGNTFRNNVAVENGAGFWFSFGEDDSGADDNMLIDNLATRNDGAGFRFGTGRRNHLIGNTASFNGVGFGLYSDEMAVRGNIAEANHGPGFEVFGSGELVGNIAKGNEGEGFVTDSSQPLSIDGNVARENGKDGFLLPSTFLAHQRVLQRNVALHNGGHGIHLVGDGKPRSRLVDNTVVGHLAPHFDLADDNPGCRHTLWRRNVFETASQACIR
jgi:parallel beta-helix repeat protein